MSHSPVLVRDVDATPHLLLPRIAWWGAAAIVLAVALDVVVHHRPLLLEGPPRLSPRGLLRLTLLVIGCALLVAAPRRRPPRPAAAGDTAPWIAALVAGSTGVAAALLVVAPGTFHRLGREDAVIETASAALLALGALLCAAAARRLQRDPTAPRWCAAVAALAAGGLLLVGLEEVSWFQRTLAIETPAAFGGNAQHELNLHNFATNAAENLYYAGGWAALVLLPFVARPGPSGAGRLVPSRRVLLAAAPAAALNFDMWSAVAMQLVFVATLCLLARGALVGEAGDRRAHAATFALCVATQLACLLAGHQQVRAWDVTEYRELFLPLGFLLAAFELYRRAASPTDRSDIGARRRASRS